MYKPDPRIVRYLREYDRDLSVRWNLFRSRWQVTWRGKDVFCVVNPDGSYRPLDERVVTQAKLNDTWTYKSADEMMRIERDERHRIEGLRGHKKADEFRQWIIEEGHQRAFGCGQFRGWTAPEARA